MKSQSTALLIDESNAKQYRKRIVVSFKPNSRLQTKEGILEYLGGIDITTYERWRHKGIVAGPVPGTNFYDVYAHDEALDSIQGLKSSKASALGRWLANAGENQRYQ